MEEARLDARILEPALSCLEGAPDLLRALPRALSFAAEESPCDTVVHGDPWVSNIFAGEAGDVSALIDLGETSVGSPYDDLRYLHSFGPRFVEPALSSYERRSGTQVDRVRLGRVHTLVAFEHVATVSGPRHTRMREWASNALKTLIPEWLE